MFKIKIHLFEMKQKELTLCAYVYILRHICGKPVNFRTTDFIHPQKSLQDQLMAKKRKRI